MAEYVRFGSYELKALLGKGGMAQVYRAVRVGPHGFAKEVALKVLDPTATATQGQIDQLTDEARLGGLLRHPNIVATDELGQVGPFYYIAMELVEGWTLDQLLRTQFDSGGAPPRQVVLAVLIEVCKGLQYLHDLVTPDGTHLQLVHRDLKPGNVMIGRGGQVKIMDFGIAKATTNLYTTQEQSTRGTPLFMSPEQVTGKELDARSDLFSIGSLMHELVTGEKTFPGDELIPILRAVLQVDIAASVERMREAFPALLPVFETCMEKSPDDRYQRATELQAVLEALRDELPPGESIAEWATRLGGSMPRPDDGELGDALPGVIILDRSVEGGVDTISMPTRSVEDVPSQFQMPLGPQAGPAIGSPMTSQSSIGRLNWEAAYPGGPPKMPDWMLSGSFMKPQGTDDVPNLEDSFVKPGRPLAVLPGQEPPSFPPEPGSIPPEPESFPPEPAPREAAPYLPPSHPMFKSGKVAIAKGRRPVTTPGRPRSTPGARPSSLPASPVPVRPTQPPTPPTSERNEGLRKRGLVPSILRITGALAIFGALVHSYSFVPGPVGDVARSVLEAARVVASWLGVDLPPTPGG